MKKIVAVAFFIFLTSTMVQAEIAFNYWNTDISDAFSAFTVQYGLTGIYTSSIANANWYGGTWENGEKLYKTGHINIPIDAYFGGTFFGFNFGDIFELTGNLFLFSNAGILASPFVTVDSGFYFTWVSTETEKIPIESFVPFMIGFAFKYPLLIVGSRRNGRLFALMPTIGADYAGFSDDFSATTWLLKGGLTLLLGKYFFIQGLYYFPVGGNISKKYTQLNCDITVEYKDTYMIGIIIGMSIMGGGTYRRDGQWIIYD